MIAHTGLDQASSQKGTGFEKQEIVIGHSILFFFVSTGMQYFQQHVCHGSPIFMPECPPYFSSSTLHCSPLCFLNDFFPTIWVA